VRRTRSPLQWGIDIAVSVLVWLYPSALVLDAPDAHISWLDLLALLSAPVAGAALLWRRSHPVPVSAVALVGSLLVQLAAPYGIFPVATLVALASLAVARPPPVSLVGLAAVLGVTAVTIPTQPDGDSYFAMAIAVVVWALGEVLRNRRAAIEQEARRAVGEEQARIARELHDVIAHSVSVIVVQAAAADDVFDSRPDQARAALRSIEAAGREVLGELRTLLGTVRPQPVDGPPQRQPGLDRLGELAAPLRAAGLEVTLRQEGGSAGPLRAEVDRSAYRIVQEALTNTLRHAGASRAEVTVRSGPDGVELDVVDNGRGTGVAPAGAGRGIVGMRERAEMLGGTLDAGPLPDGGFRVHARLPAEPIR
jgi:signal transduction histidine kinase